MEFVEDLKKEIEGQKITIKQLRYFLGRYQRSMKAYQAIIDLMEDQMNLYQDVKSKQYGYMGLRKAMLKVEVENINELDKVILRTD